ncbi:SGNH/GDSL hydrolase family protein [Pontibacter sp. SGAir0037]|uniref:SGNH/GDSL hydrolase family protein n=1 Tax=Pontibacter sp. SGAir0037 TaxID=2571030 RepID=UPI0010CD5DB0|nr:SGNH/GDSL hydrolase family protein [Pontibacter sp. SGAir0037]QCR21478.1 G-D-S-L family lipolytic protein [Pontibacter sp. SGAir0037]
MKYLPSFLLSLLLLCILGTAQAQQNKPPFWDEIQAFKKQDSLQAPPKDAILFVGSSSFRMWGNVQEMFPEHKIINRGFGGSTLPDLAYYLNDIVFPYQPRQVVIYSGENDIASGTVHAQEVFKRFEAVFTAIREKLPKATLTFVSIKPSPSREQYMPVVVEANNLIKSYLKKQKNAQFVDVYPLMLQKNGKPMADIFIEDNLHMNQKGYTIWQNALRPYLKK